MADTAERQTPGFAEVSLDDIPEIQRMGKASRVVEAFLESGMQAAEVTDHAKTFSQTLKRYVKRNGVPVAVLNRGGKIYLKLTDEGETPEPDEDEAE